MVKREREVERERERGGEGRGRGREESSTRKRIGMELHNIVPLHKMAPKKQTNDLPSGQKIDRQKKKKKKKELRTRTWIETDLRVCE